jgi:hypothetical protein
MTTTYRSPLAASNRRMLKVIDSSLQDISRAYVRLMRAYPASGSAAEEFQTTVEALRRSDLMLREARQKFTRWM